LFESKKYLTFQQADIMNKKTRMVYFLSHPIQYFSPLLRELAKVVDLQIYYFSDASIKGTVDKGFGKAVTWDTSLLDGYSNIFLKNYCKDRGLNNRFLDVWNPGVWKAIRKSKADVIIINDWTYSSTWMVLLIAAFTRKEVWLRAESPLNQELRKSRKVLMIKKLFLKSFLFRFLVKKCLYIGTQNKAFFKYYGISEDRLVFTPYAVDNDFFREAWLANKDQLPKIKERLGLPAGKKIVVFSGKYINKKRPLDLLKAFKGLDKDKYILLMVGEGELRPAMEQFIKDHALNHIFLTGFVNQSEIPLYYSVADVFVMCSAMGETWGLSVNEAMNFSKPVIVSETCGCSTDLVKHGENGFVFEEGNVQQLTHYLKELLENEVFCKKAGQKSLEVIDKYSITTIIENIKRVGLS
jgi:glycosyltransferase involved in cell wall biosynthesis